MNNSTNNMNTEYNFSSNLQDKILRNKIKIEGSTIYSNHFRKTVQDANDFSINGEEDEIEIMGDDLSWKVECVSLFQAHKADYKDTIVYPENTLEDDPLNTAFDATDNVKEMYTITCAHVEYKTNLIAKNFGWKLFFEEE